MKKVMILLMILLVAVPVFAGPIQMMQGTVARKNAGSGGGGDGFVGNNAAANDTTIDGGTNEVFLCVFTASASGTISYIHFVSDSSLSDVAPPGSSVGIYDASYNLLATSAQINVVGSSQNDAVLISPIEITSGTSYGIAFGTEGDSYWRMAGTTGGTTYEQDNGYSSGLPDPISLSTLDSNCTMTIWADNSSDGS